MNIESRDSSDPGWTSTLGPKATLSEREAAKLMWKIDCKVIPMLFLVYLVAFLDR